MLLALLQARAWTRLGRVDDATAALGRWRDEQDRIPAGDEGGGVLGLSLAQQHYLAGSTYLWLRDPAQALSETEHGIVEFEATPTEGRFYGAEMLARIDAARAHLARDELDGAIRVVEPVLALEPDQRLSTFTDSLAQLSTTLATPTYRGSPAAQQLQERIEDYTRTAITRELELRR